MLAQRFRVETPPVRLYFTDPEINKILIPFHEHDTIIN